MDLTLQKDLDFALQITWISRCKRPAYNAVERPGFNVVERPGFLAFVVKICGFHAVEIRGFHVEEKPGFDVVTGLGFVWSNLHLK